MPSKPQTRRPRAKAGYHHGALREALIEAGLARLEADGGDPLSIRELARDAGVSPTAVYRHFTDKEDLLAALAAEGFRRLQQGQTKAAEQHDDPRQALLVAGEAYMQFAEQHPALYRMMFGRYGATHRGGDLGEAAMSSFLILAKQVAQASDLEPGDPQTLSETIHAWGLIHGLSSLRIDGQLDQMTPDPGQALRDALNAAPRRESRAKN